MKWLRFLGRLFQIGGGLVALTGIAVSYTGKYDQASYLVALGCFNILVGNIYLEGGK